METKKPQAGRWTLTAPDGRIWEASTPMLCCRKEQKERVPDAVRAARLEKAINDERDIMTEDQLKFAKFYSVKTLDGIIETQARQIERLQARLPKMSSGALPGRVREG